MLSSVFEITIWIYRYKQKGVSAKTKYTQGGEGIHMGVCMCIFVDGRFSKMIYSWESHTKDIHERFTYEQLPGIKIYL